MKKSTVTILSFDPGLANFAFAVNQITIQQSRTGEVKLSFKLITNGLVPQTLRAATKKEFNPGMGGFVDHTCDLLLEHKPHILVAERFMNRGAIGGNSSELIGYMLGATYVLGRGLVKAFRLIGASTWKNAIRRRGVNLDHIYDDLCDMSVKKSERITPHQIDAVLIGIYAAHRLVKLKGFEFVPSTKELRRMIENTQTLIPVVKRPVKKKRAKKRR